MLWVFEGFGRQSPFEPDTNQRQSFDFVAVFAGEQPRDSAARFASVVAAISPMMMVEQRNMRQNITMFAHSAIMNTMKLSGEKAITIYHRLVITS